MRPRDRRAQERQAKIAAGDERAKLLAATPAADRSEVVARYDHQGEANAATAADYLEAARDSLTMSRRAQAMLAGYECGRIRIRLEQLMARVTCGMLPAHVETKISAILAEMPPVTDEEIAATAQTMLTDRLAYLRARYGVTRNV